MVEFNERNILKTIEKIEGLSDGYMNIYEQINDLLYEKRDISTGNESEVVEDKENSVREEDKRKEK